MSVHDLKVWPDFFARLLDGSKTFEIRRNDRGYQAGDTLRLREYDPAGDHDTCTDKTCSRCRYTGRELIRTVGFVAAGTLFGLELGSHAVLSLLPPTKQRGDNRALRDRKRSRTPGSLPAVP